MENLWSPLGHVTTILTQGAYVLRQDEIQDEDDHHNKDNTADIADYLTAGVGHDRCDILGDNPCEPEPATQSELTLMRTIMEEQREMLTNAHQQNTQLCVQNARLMETNK